MILPFMELKNIFNLFNLSLPIAGPANMQARSIEIGTFLCPEDAYNKTPFMSSLINPNVIGDNWARGNYAANAALGMGSYGIHPDSACS